ncbi:hypothetical protein A1O1_06785 [Capronia coronata CBS 617.96]|uniref:Uncharacterized protein n=1 Tax=Capronia coronata CBS 617.96 TaxID=1182541 RepID=W9Y1P0_9EURO|nr:uncharacterized protein A1O1_06785 [Capronia coronata CBS 617.96]EXJ83166.1 hypothetical protein A1O1_06785 [Capronia coronata CBS 617.96]
MAQSEREWPLDFPCISKADFHYQTNNVPKGAKGKVVGRNDDWLFITMPYEKQQQSSWIPLSYLEIGKNRKCGDLAMKVNLPAIRPSQLTVPLNQQSRLRRAIEAFLLELRENAESLHFLPPWFCERLRSLDQLRTMINTIMQGMRPAVLQLLNTGNFTIENLRVVLEPVAPKDNRGGIYSRIYFGFPMNAQGVRR